MPSRYIDRLRVVRTAGRICHLLLGMRDCPLPIGLFDGAHIRRAGEGAEALNGSIGSIA